MRMFDNILFQDRAVRQLTSMVLQDRVPPVLLFAGPEASGKMTTALELARVLSCERHGDWNCPCPQCARHRSLTHSDLLLFGPRDITQEPRVAADLYLRSPSLSSWFAFVRSVRKLLRRFDPVLWEGEESKLSKSAPVVESIEELLQELSEKKDIGMTEKTRAAIEKIVDNAAGLESAIPDGIPVFMVRNMSTWATMSPVGRSKMVIIQNADTAGESARNAMLKILEEPPSTVRFVLTASRRATVIATILSRSQLIGFDHRTPQQSQAIVTRLFKLEEQVQDLGEFFRKRSAFSPERADFHARLFLGILFAESVVAETSPPGGTIAEVITLAREAGLDLSSMLRALSEETGGFGNKNPAFADSFLTFLRALTRVLRQISAEPAPSPALVMLIDRISKHIREMATHYRSLNRSPELMLEAFAGIFGGFNEGSL